MLGSNNKGLVSCIIIFYNAERYLAEAIESVLSQTEGNWELILVDDGSSDNGVEIARRFIELHKQKIRLVSHPENMNMGISASRNLGLRHAEGEYVAFLDADDKWSNQFISIFVDSFRKHLDAHVVVGSTMYWYSWQAVGTEAKDIYHSLDKCFELREGVFDAPELMGKYLSARGAAPAICSIMVKRQALCNVGGFNDNFKGLYEDQVIIAKLLLNLKMVLIDQSHAWYRQHPESMCHSTGAREGYLARRKYLSWLQLYLKSQKKIELLPLVKREIGFTRSQYWSSLLSRPGKLARMIASKL